MPEDPRSADVEGVYGYLAPEAASLLDEERTKMRAVLEPGLGGIEITDREFLWWTFAGGRINSTLRYALSAIEPDWSIIPDNYSVTLRGDTLNMERFLAALERLSSPDFWDNAGFWQDVAAALPNYRLSKFSP